MGKGNKNKPKGPPPPRTVFEHLAHQTGTKSEEWCYVTKSSRQYKAGFRYWHPRTDQYAKRAAE